MGFLTGGINEPLELAGDLSLPYLDFRTFLGVLKCVMNPSAKRIEELFLKYMQFIEDGFPTSSRDDKLEAFMRVSSNPHWTWLKEVLKVYYTGRW